MCPGARRLGAGAPITVLQFAPLARLRPVLGFHALILRVCQVHLNKGAFCRCRDNKLEGGTSRRPNFFVFRPIEVPKEPRLGVFGCSEAIGAVGLVSLSIVRHVFEHFEQLIIMIHWKLDQEM
jgi:hypothetical protein